MKQELYVGERKPSPRRMEAIANLPYFYKPLGGLWTSSYDKKAGSDWVQWCINQNFHVPTRGFNRYVLEWSRANLIIIDNLQDLRHALKEYHVINDLVFLRPIFDYEKLAQDFDGLHLTRRGQQQTHRSYPESLCTFDVESTIWFRWVFDRVKPMGRRIYK